MKDWEGIVLTAGDIDNLYKSFKKKLIEEGFIEANPKRWVRPKINDCMDFFTGKLGLSDQTYVTAHEFFNYWDDLDWMVRKTRIKSWKGRANTWIKNNEKYKRNDSQRFNGVSTADQIAASIADRNR